MSANRKQSNSRLNSEPTTPIKGSVKTSQEASLYTAPKREKRQFESKIPVLGERQASFNDKKKEALPHIIQRSSTFNNKVKKAKLPEYKEEPDIKARPFKQKVGFFVKKSDKILTVPVEPKLGIKKK